MIGCHLANTLELQYRYLQPAASPVQPAEPFWSVLAVFGGPSGGHEIRIHLMHLPSVLITITLKGLTYCGRWPDDNAFLAIGQVVKDVKIGWGWSIAGVHGMNFSEGLECCLHDNDCILGIQTTAIISSVVIAWKNSLCRHINSVSLSKQQHAACQDDTALMSTTSYQEMREDTKQTERERKPDKDCLKFSGPN